MLTMILKMSGVTAIYVVLFWLLWRKYRDKKLRIPEKLMIGLIFGIVSVLSTHFGVEYSHMILNIRDVGPLSAGLFFDPVSGIIAGLIGGIERFIAGTYWGTGAYTTVACSVSTCLAGFLAAGLRMFAFRKKRPSVIDAFFIGAVMEVFHMYAVFITHQDDMDMAFYVVKYCAGPMVTFSAIALALSSLVAWMIEKKGPVKILGRKRSDFPVSRIFQTFLIIVTLIMILVSFFFTFDLQTRAALQKTREMLSEAAADVESNYYKVNKMQSNINNMAIDDAMSFAKGIAVQLENAGGAEAADESIAQDYLDALELVSLNIIGDEGTVIAGAGSSYIYESKFRDVYAGAADSEKVLLSDALAGAAVRCTDGVVQVVISTNGYKQDLEFRDINTVLSDYHVGNEGVFDIVRSTGYILAGNHYLSFLDSSDMKELLAAPEKTPFEFKYFGVPSLCRKEKMDDNTILLTALPMTEVYAERDIQAYESALSSILLFAVIYGVITLLVRRIVVNRLEQVNKSLDAISNGNLNEVVNVRSSREFNSLSDDINHTVDVLKGYITAAEKRMEQELIVAKNIQESALPRNFQFPRSDFELYATMDPAKEVGGDFYDFFFVDRDKLALVIADVSGKGIPASLFMMRGKTLIQTFAGTDSSPADILFKANNALCEGNDAEMFITAWIGIIDLQTGVMKCANAGHEYPEIMHKDEDYEIYKDRHGLVLAAMEGVKFKEYELQFRPGDKLFVYTDGVPEAVNEELEQYGTDRLTEVLNQLKEKPAQEVLVAVRQDISDFVGNADQFDDITMLGFEYKGQ